MITDKNTKLDYLRERIANMRNTLFSSLYNRFSPFYMTGLFLLFACLYPSNAYAAKFNTGDTVEVYNTSGVGLRLRSCASTSCSSQVTMPDGTQMTVSGGPYSADGYTWWGLYGYVYGTYYSGYSAEDYLKKVSSSCSYSLSQTSQSVGSSGGTYSVWVYTTSECSWTATSNTSWITISSGSSGSWNGTVSYSVSTNTSSSQRTGYMTIAGNTFTVTQEGQVTCTYSISPSNRSHGSGSETGTISVTPNSSICSWQAYSNDSWITITSGSSGSGNGTVYYSVSANSSSSSRTGTITIYGASSYTFTVYQSGICTYSMSSTSQSVGNSGGTYYISVYTSSGCSWTATSNTSWITITSGSSGRGNGTVSYSVSTNTSSSSRTGTMSIAGQTFTVTQDPSTSKPTVTTGTYQTISSSSVQLFGTVNPNGLSTTGWFEWGTTSSYGNTTNSESLGSGTSVVQMLHTISGLSSSTTNHFRAVGQNGAGTSYGEDMSFTTSAPATIKPTVTTDNATSVTSTSATLKGTVNPNGAATTGWFEWGTTSSYGNTTQTFSGGSGSSDVTMSWNISGLSSGTTYHYMAVAENSAGTSYGSDVSFTTTSPTPTPSATPTGSPPTVTTGTYQTISSSSVQLFGTINPNGAATTGWFEWGTTSSYGNTTNTESLGSGTSVVQMLHTISGLSASTTYHFRAVGQNSAGTRYGEDMSFTTSATAVTKPTVTTNAATSVASSSATLNGKVNPNGASTTGWFEWGTTSSYGNTTQTFSGGSGSSEVTMSWGISGLSPGTTYHYKAVAENSAGTSPGSDVSFTTSSCTYLISPTTKSFTSSGGSGNVSVTTSSGCSWTATSNVSWITITSGSSGSGNGTVKYSVSANTDTSQRTGTITIAGQTFTITQDKASPTPSSTPTPTTCSDNYEPNDTSTQAYGYLSSGSSYSGKICSSSDVDWFKVNITTKGTISLNLTVPSSKDYDLELYDPSYAWIAGSYSSNTSESISKKITTTGIYYIRIYGSNGSYSATNSYTLTYTFTSTSNDTTKPTGSITINSGASYTKSTTVTLSLTARDSIGVTGYYLSTSSTKPSSGNTGWTSISSTTSYSSDVSYTLSSGDGSKTVYVWYKDTAGNVSDTVSDSITLDTTAPTVTITSPTSDGTYTTTNSTIGLGGNATDSTSGVSNVKWSNNTGGSGTASGTTSWSLSSISLLNGDNTITVTAADNAGNSGTDSITAKYSSGTVPTPSPKATPSPTTSPSEENLLGKYAPILYMHEDERFYPIGAEEMLTNSDLYKKEDDTITLVYDRSLTTLEYLMNNYNENTYYLKLKDGWDENKSVNYWKNNPIVYGRSKTMSNNKIALQYWFFYIYNEWGTAKELGNTHEGDWEMIQIVLDKDQEPEKITYSFHHGGLTFQRDDNSLTKVKKIGSHPHVYVTLGGHGCWHRKGSNIWYRKDKCWKCIDKTDDNGDVLYPDKMNVSEIQSSSKYPYTLIDVSGSVKDDSKYRWLYWKGYWGNQAWEKGVIDIGRSGPRSPRYINYLDNGYPRWLFPKKWADAPKPSYYVVCLPENSKIVIRDLEGNLKVLSDYCNWRTSACYKKCSNTKIIYSEKDLLFDIFSLDGEEVNLKISRYKRTTGEVCDVEFDWLEIPKNGKATLRFSPDENPNLEMEIDHDQDGIFDYRVSPDYATQNP